MLTSKIFKYSFNKNVAALRKGGFLIYKHGLQVRAVLVMGFIFYHLITRY